MTIFRNECVDCGLPCMGNSCPHMNVPHSFCDECGTESLQLFDVDGMKVCKKCLDNMFDFRIIETEDEVFVCEECGRVTDILYDVDGEEVCDECFYGYFPEVTA